MSLLILSILTSFIIVLIGTPPLIKVALLKQFVDQPGNDRKLHEKSTPNVGGVIIFAATIFTALGWLTFLDIPFITLKPWLIALSSAVPIFFMGLKDDIIGIAPLKKLTIHIFIGFMIIVLADIRIEGFYGLFGLETLPIYVSYLFSLFVYVVIVNAINLIDGVDGLAGGWGVIAMAAFTYWFHLTNQPEAAIVAASLGGSLLGFLIFNFHPARIFMGDSGALIVGLITFVLAVKVIGTPYEAIPDFLHGVSKPVLAMGILAYPLVDTIRVFFIRLFRGGSPFSPDNLHIHHLLIGKGLGHRKTSIIIWICSVFFSIISFISINSISSFLNPTTHFLAYMSFAILIGALPNVLPKLRKK
jgi:UDP-GlcNAc:undecaprenyl-phosphate GlcNAc-1-phosphate transferase